MHQPTLVPDQVSVSIAVPKGFEVVKAEGLKVSNGRAEGTMELDRTRTLRIKLAHSDHRTLWERLRDGT